MTPTVSIAAITKNEAHNIGPFFAALKGFADELVIVDTGSSDGTQERIREEAARAGFPVRFFERRLEPFHFGKAKNLAIDRATGQYVFVLDADERPAPDLREGLKQELTDKAPSVVSLKRIDELVPHYADRQTRVFKNGSGIRYGEDAQAAVHEALIFEGNVLSSRLSILHQQGKNHWLRRPARVLQQLRMEIARTPRLRSRGYEFLHAPIGFFYKFRSVYLRRGAYRDGLPGLAYAMLKGLYAAFFHVGVATKPYGNA